MPIALKMVLTIYIIIMGQSWMAAALKEETPSIPLLRGRTGLSGVDSSP